MTSRATRRAFGALVAATALACSRVSKVEQPAAPTTAEPKAAEKRGVAPSEQHPPVPAAPQGLLGKGAVIQIQRRLATRGLLGEHREGELDPPTSSALQKFQRSQALADTGFPDRETLRRLDIDPDEAYGEAREKPR